MAWDGNQFCIPGLKAGADLSAETNRYRLVKLSAANTVVLCTAVTDKAVGVLQNRPLSGENAKVCAWGLTKVRGGAGLSVDDRIAPATDAEAVAVTHGSDTTTYPIGTVLEGTSNAGEYGTAMVDCVSPNRAA